MTENKLYRCDGVVYRVLSVQEKSLFVINCEKNQMPKTVLIECFSNAEEVPESVLAEVPKESDLSPASLKKAYKTFNSIAVVLPFLQDKQKRNHLIQIIANQNGISVRTVQNQILRYLIFQNVTALAPKKASKRPLTADEKNMRKALNRYFYTQQKHSLATAYALMLKDFYTIDGILQLHPSIHQFRYFYRKTQNLAHSLISRDGINRYKRDRRPCVGGGITNFAPNAGTAMLDSTICDIYITNDSGAVVGRPLLLLAVDANTSFCLGYALLWEGGVYSVQNLLLNILEDKVALCKKMGITIKPEQWNTDKMPGILLTDNGREYASHTFDQLTELGITVVNLPPYRPDLKGRVEKAFDIIQNLYKDALADSGVVMPDFGERGAPDYRKQACLTMADFEKIIVRCILYYNNERVISNYPYTAEMLSIPIKPCASAIWNIKKEEPFATLISVSRQQLALTLLPRTIGKWSRFGCKVNQLHYCTDQVKNKLLAGGTDTIAYNPDDCSFVWLVQEDGSFIKMSLTAKQYAGASFEAVLNVRNQKNQILKRAAEQSCQAKTNLLSDIEAITNRSQQGKFSPAGIRKAKNKAKIQRHLDMGEIINEE